MGYTELELPGKLPVRSESQDTCEGNWTWWETKQVACERGEGQGEIERYRRYQLLCRVLAGLDKIV